MHTLPLIFMCNGLYRTGDDKESSNSFSTFVLKWHELAEDYNNTIEWKPCWLRKSSFEIATESSVVENLLRSIDLTFFVAD